MSNNYINIKCIKLKPLKQHTPAPKKESYPVHVSMGEENRIHKHN